MFTEFLKLFFNRFKTQQLLLSFLVRQRKQKLSIFCKKDEILV
ncbi:hypothetical protein SITYG_04300 [Streptococcus intermedius]|uniref:Uncharacterized protein n=1 Tax=Streptococcus intermedius TaxID=1338 RepID=A0AAD1C7H3_STRIT|nr:hypothetical protein SITYG_04300 [Streptococcus intermedius]